MPAARWIRSLALAGLLLCFTVVVLCAYVRLSAAGLGCPDWPGCYGHVTPIGAEHSAATDDAYAARPLVPGKAWRALRHGDPAVHHRDAHRHLAAEASDRDAAPPVRHDDARAPVVAHALTALEL